MSERPAGTESAPTRTPLRGFCFAARVRAARSLITRRAPFFPARAALPCVCREAHYFADANYLSRHPSILPKMRALLADWLIEVCAEFLLHRETYYMVSAQGPLFYSTNPVKLARGRH